MSRGGDIAEKKSTFTQFTSNIVYVMTAAEITYEAAESGLMRYGGRAGNFLGFESAGASSALESTIGITSKMGKVAGSIGYGLSVVSIGTKVITGQKITTAYKVNFGVSTVLVGAAAIATGTVAAPFVAAASLIYGAAELGSFLFTSKSLEENIFKQ